MNIFGLRRTHGRPKNWSHVYINSLGNEVNCIVDITMFGSTVFVLNEYGCTVKLSANDLIEK